MEPDKRKAKWVRETARDLIALGSVPFFLLVIARVSILSKPAFLYQFIFSGAIFFVLALLFRGNLYAGFGWIVLLFTCLYYGDLKFAAFATLVYAALLASLVFLKYDRPETVKGILLGLLSSAVGWYAVTILIAD